MVLSDKVQDKPMLADLDILLLPNRLQQGSFDLFTGNIFVVEDAELRMTAFSA
jgi:hypothetical protein